MTAAGQQLAERAIVILDQVEAARLEIANATQLLTGHLAIGTTQTPGPLDIGQLLFDFHAAYPSIDLGVREELSLAIADRLRADEIDLGFVAELPEPSRHGLEMRRIASEPLVVSLPLDHPFANLPEIDFGDLREEAFVLFPEGATIRGTFDHLAASHGITPHVAFVTTDTDRMCELVARGLGVGLLPRSDAERHRENHAIATIRDDDLAYNVYLAYRRNRNLSPAAMAMGALIDLTFPRDGLQP